MQIHVSTSVVYVQGQILVGTYVNLCRLCPRRGTCLKIYVSTVVDCLCMGKDRYMCQSLSIVYVWVKTDTCVNLRHLCTRSNTCKYMCVNLLRLCPRRDICRYMCQPLSYMCKGRFLQQMHMSTFFI